MMNPVIPFLARTDETDRQLWLAALKHALPDFRIEPFAQLTAQERDAATVAIAADPDPDDFHSLPNLQWVQSLWAGVEQIAAELPRNNLRIVRMEDPQMAETMGEAVLAWTLYLHRDMPRYARQQHACQWIPHELPLPKDRTIGILGMGNLGGRAAEKLLQQGFKVCGWSRTERAMDGVRGFSGAEGLNRILAISDILIILLPLTEETSGLLERSRLGLMPNGSSLINFARGPIVDDAALLECLDSGQIDHAVLDVFDEEPLPQSSPFWAHPGVTVLPHISGPTNRDTASAIVAANITAFFADGKMPTGIDRAKGY